MSPRDHEVTRPALHDPAPERDDALPPDRIAELRIRITSGAYDTAAAVDAVARRIMMSGDV
jgi:hypothetical protein